jgi:hypothetical protein
LPIAVFSENWSTSPSGYNCSRSSCSSLVIHWSNCNKLDSCSWSWETFDFYSDFLTLQMHFGDFLECLNLLKSCHEHLGTLGTFCSLLSQFPQMGNTWFLSRHVWWREEVRGKWVKR